MSRNSRTSPRGFTLIEIGVVILVVAIMMGVAIPTLQSVTGAKARAEVSKLAANIRATRGHAAVAGETCRMVFCIESCGSEKRGESQPDDSYYVECSKGSVPMQHENVRNGKLDDSDDVPDQQHMTEAEKARYEIMKKNAFAPNKTLPMQKLAGINFSSVWTAHQSEKYEKGKAFLYFYPSGLTERANIQLQDGDDWYSIHVSPLSGKVSVVGAKEDLPDQRDEED